MCKVHLEMLKPSLSLKSFVFIIIVWLVQPQDVLPRQRTFRYVKCHLSRDTPTIELNGKPNAPTTTMQVNRENYFSQKAFGRAGSPNILPDSGRTLCRLLTFMGSLTLGQSITY